MQIELGAPTPKYPIPKCVHHSGISEALAVPRIWQPSAKLCPLQTDLGRADREFTQNGFPTQRSHTRLSSQRSPLTHPTPIRRYVVQKGIAAKPKSCDKPARHFAYTRMRSAWGRSCLSRSPSCARSSLPSAPTVPFHRTQSSTLCAGRAEPGAPPPRAARWRRHEASDIFGDTENQSKNNNNNNNQDIGEERGAGTKSASSTRGWRARSSG